MKQVLVGTLSLLGLLFSNPCDAYELKKNSEGKTIRWAEDTIVLEMSDAFAERFGQERAMAAARGAASAWSDVPGVPTIVIRMAETPSFQPESPANCIHLASEWHEAGDELALTYTLSTPRGYVAATAIVVNGEHSFDVLDDDDDSRGDDGRHDDEQEDDDRDRGEERDWDGEPRDHPATDGRGLDAGHRPVGGASSSFDLQAVLTHEMGHVLGLAENHHDEEVTMHPDIGPGETFQRSLADDDRAGAMAIYEEEPPNMGSCSLATNRAVPTNSWSTWLAAFLLVLSAGRRRLMARRDVVTMDDSPPCVANESIKRPKVRNS